jgi:hypothetical protein
MMRVANVGGLDRRLRLAACARPIARDAVDDHLAATRRRAR